VPNKGEKAETDEYVVTVEKVERTRVVEVLVAVKTAPAPEAS